MSADCHIRARIEQVAIKAKVEQTAIRVDVRGGRGPVGPQGPAGPAGGQVLTRAADTALSGHRMVKVTATGVGYPSLSAAGDAELLLGVTTGAAEAGAQASIQVAGEMVEPSWSWSLGPVFCGEGGALVQSPPAGVWLRQIGVATAPTKIFIDMRPSIFTA